MILRQIVLGFLLQGMFLACVFPDTLVVANKADDTASLIDLQSGTVMATLPTGHQPAEVAISGDERLAVITNYGEEKNPGNSLTLINIPEGRVIQTISFSESRRPHGIQCLDGNQFVVTVEANKAVIVVDIESGKISRSIKTGEKISHMLVLSPDRTRAFVTNVGSGSVSVLDLDEGKRIKNIKTDAGSEGISMRPDGKAVWVTNRAADTLSVIDTDTLKVIDTKPSPKFPIRTQITPDGDYVLISNARSNDVIMFDATYNKIYGRVKMPGKNPMPTGITIRPDSKVAYVSLTGADAISVMDLEKWKVVNTIQVGKRPGGSGYSSLSVEQKKSQPISPPRHEDTK